MEPLAVGVHGLRRGNLAAGENGGGCSGPAPLAGEGGGFAEYIKRLGDGCFRLPDGLTWDEGALVEPLAVGVHGLRRGNLAAGETVVVLGSGTIGLTTLVAARALGAGKVFLTARHPQQTKMAMRLGAVLHCLRTVPSYGRRWRQLPTGVAPMWWSRR